MVPFATFFAGAIPVSAEFIATQAMGSGGASSTLGSLGAANGDLLVSVGSSAALSNGHTLTSLGNLAIRSLTASDLTATATGGSSYFIAIYRGVATMALVVTSSTPGSVAGFTKNTKHAGICGLVLTDGNTSGGISSPATFALRQGATIGSAGNRLLDRLFPPNDAYVNSASFTWSGTGSTNTLNIFEFRTA